MTSSPGLRPGFLRYPRGRLLAVVDSPTAADAVVERLVAAGIAPTAVELYRGDDAARAFDGTGVHNGVFARLRRSVEFLLMDQAPDLAWYEAAARSGRTVISVRPKGTPQVASAVAVLRAGGAHFINHFGLLATEEIERWRGAEPELPEYLKR
jgi:hypothetical protein